MTRAGGSRSDAEVARELVSVGVATAFGVWRAARATPVRSKANATDVVTAADVAAEAAMVDLLARHRPDDGVVGEEGATVPSRSGRTWVLDPLDGTYNFTRDAERWCAAAALLVDGASVLGAVSGGGAARTWVGGHDVPVAEDGSTVPSVTDRPLAAAQVLTYLHPPHHATEVGVAWRRLVAGAATLRMTGSGSLDAVDVACGRAELSVQHSVPLWDSAPGEAIVRAAGGAARRVRAAGVEWFLLGTPSAVTEGARLLADG